MLRAAPVPRRIGFSLPRLRIVVAILATSLTPFAQGATLTEKARESNCTGKPKQVEGAMYKCETQSGAMTYFNVPDMTAPAPAERTPRSPTGNAVVAPAPSSPSGARPPTNGFPRVDAETQKGRDDMRRRVLRDELSAEEKLLAESRTAYADGAPPALPEERDNADKYRERIARLRQAVVLHERNVEALRKEIAGLR